MIQARPSARTAPAGLGRRGRCVVLGAPRGLLPALAVKAAFVVRALALLTVIEVGLRRGTLDALCDRLGLRLRTGVTPDEDRPSGQMPWAELHRAAARGHRVLRLWPFESTCLRRCLLYGALLRDHRPGLVLGVRRDETGAVAAHAWLVIAGRTVDPEAKAFASFPMA